jgi:hypothetical protein
MFLISDTKGNFYKLADSAATDHLNIFSKCKKGRALILWNMMQAGIMVSEICRQECINYQDLIVGDYEIEVDGTLKRVQAMNCVIDSSRINWYNAVRNTLVSNLMWNGEDNKFHAVQTESWMSMNGDKLDWKAAVVINGDPDNYTLHELQVLSEISRIRTGAYDRLGYYRHGMNLTIITKEGDTWFRRRSGTEMKLIRKDSLYDLIDSMKDLESRCIDQTENGIYKNYKNYLLSITK